MPWAIIQLPMILRISPLKSIPFDLQVIILYLMRYCRANISALDDRKFIGITGLTFSGSNNLPMNGATLIYANDRSIMSQLSNVCSSYSPDLCYDVGRFYTPKFPQVSAVGLFALDGETILQWGFNTGFDAPKVTVSPAIMIGLAKRFYFSEARDSHLIIEASTWLGEHVKHRPCLDSFDREFFCGTISAWKDFTYEPHPKSDFIKITYVKLF
jgi:hypothetical protein